MKNLLLVFMSLFLFAGCMTMGNKQITDENVVSQIKAGASTKSDVKEKVGEPSKITFTDNGEEVWDYNYMRGKVRAASFIPVVGIVAGGTDVDTQTLTIRFNKDGIVKEIGKGRTVGGGGSILD